MTHLDLSPLFSNSIGFDHLLSLFEYPNAASKGQKKHPQYNIETIDTTHYKISIAVPGFMQNELDIEANSDVLKISGKKRTEKNKVKYLYQSIKTENFELVFKVDKNVEVENARLENGMLYINIKREIPEALKPRRITIEDTQKLIDSKTSNAA